MDSSPSLFLIRKCPGSLVYRRLSRHAFYKVVRFGKKILVGAAEEYPVISKNKPQVIVVFVKYFVDP